MSELKLILVNPKLALCEAWRNHFDALSDVEIANGHFEKLPDACPGLGTTTGQVPFDEAAQQMALAYQNFLKPPTYINRRYAHNRQKNG